MGRAAFQDMECWRRWGAVNQGFDLPATCLQDADLMERAREIGGNMPPPNYDLERPELDGILATT